MRLLGAALAGSVGLSALTLPAYGQTIESVSAEPDSVAVVVYRDRPVDTAALMQRSRQPWSQLDRQGLALIIEKRTVDVPRGQGIIRFQGLGTGIVPHSAMIEGLPADVLEQNADYELISPASLLEKSVGQTVTVVRTNASTGDLVEEAAILRAGSSGAVLQIGDRYEALDCSGLTKRIVFDEVPAGLGATPTLSVKTRAEEAGRYTVTLAYLATGLQWSADYVARMSTDGRTLDLQGWITLANFGGTSFADAPVVVVAGDLARESDTRPVQVRTRNNRVNCWPQMRTDQIQRLYRAEDRREYEGPPMALPAPPRLQVREAVDDIVVTANRVKAELEELGDYKAYVLPHLTTVAARQTKQVLFLDQEAVPVRHIRALNLSETGEGFEPANVILLMRNRAEDGMGLPVPGGAANVMLADQGDGMMWGGQVSFEDTPAGLPLRLTLGQDELLTYQVIQTLDDSRGRKKRRKAVEGYRVTVKNTAVEDAAVEIDVPFYVAQNRGFRIERESLRSHIDRDRGVRVWTIDLPAGDERTFDVRWSYDDPE